VKPWGLILSACLASPAIADAGLMEPCLQAHTSIDRVTAAITADGWREITEGEDRDIGLMAAGEVWHRMQVGFQSMPTAEDADENLRSAHRTGLRLADETQVFGQDGAYLTLRSREDGFFFCTVTAPDLPNWDRDFAAHIEVTALDGSPSGARLLGTEATTQPGTTGDTHVTIDRFEFTYPEGITEPVYAPVVMQIFSALLDEG